MCNKFTDFKKYLFLLSPHEQIYEFDGFINYKKIESKKSINKIQNDKRIKIDKKANYKVITLNYFF